MLRGIKDIYLIIHIRSFYISKNVDASEMRNHSKIQRFMPVNRALIILTQSVVNKKFLLKTASLKNAHSNILVNKQEACDGKCTYIGIYFIVFGVE